MAKAKGRKLKTWEERINGWLEVHDNCLDDLIVKSEGGDWKGSWAACQVGDSALAKAFKIMELYGGDSEADPSEKVHRHVIVIKTDE